MVVGSVELVPLVDAIGVLGPLDELYPETSAPAWELYRALYSELFAGDSWRIFCTCYLIRSHGETVLVDTGVGPPGLWDWDPESEGGLLPSLAQQGVAPADVDVVLLTHVHVDHVGWNADAEGAVVFPNARYVLHAAALATAHERAARPHIPRCVLGIADRLDAIEGETDLASGVTAVELPGHDPGHLGVRIGADAFLISDAAVHPALLDRPGTVYVSDHDHDQVAATRRALLAELVDRPTLAVCGHYPGGGIGRVVTRGEAVVWEAA